MIYTGEIDKIRKLDENELTEYLCHYVPYVSLSEEMIHFQTEGRGGFIYFVDSKELHYYPLTYNQGFLVWRGDEMKRAVQAAMFPIPMPREKVRNIHSWYYQP